MTVLLPKKIALITPPFIGHYGVLSKLAERWAAPDSGVIVTFIVTGWESIRLAETERNILKALNIQFIELNASPPEIPAPFHFTFPRVLELTDALIEICQDQDLLIYDFFSIEGYIAGKVLNIPAWCSIRILGPFDPMNPAFLEALTQNENNIRTLETRYSIDLFNRIQFMGESFFLPSDEHTLQWSWPTFIEIDDYQKNRNLPGVIFMRPHYPIVKAQKSSYKKIVYFALGSIITQYLWEDLTLQKKTKKLVQILVEALDAHPDYEVIVATGRNISDLFERIPANFQVYETVDQFEILKYANLFITHAGPNSVNEAIDTDVPLIAIPFFGDQYQSAMNISRLKIGVAFVEEPYLKNQCPHLEGVYDLEQLFKKGQLLKIIHDMTHQFSYQEALQKIKAPYTQEMADMTALKNILAKVGVYSEER